MIPPVKLRQACSRPRREKGITLPSTIWKATRWAPENRPSIRRKKRVAARSGAPEKNQPAKAMPRICTRIRVPIRIEAGRTRLRCSICDAPMIGDTTWPTCCSERPKPTMALGLASMRKPAGRKPRLCEARI